MKNITGAFRNILQEWAAIGFPLLIAVGRPKQADDEEIDQIPNDIGGEGDSCSPMDEYPPGNGGAGKKANCV